MRSFTESAMGNNEAALNTQKEFLQGPGLTQASIIVGVAAAPALVSAGIAAAGFGPGGIAAGSWAAGFMASYGGSVATGSACAILQSAGAAGLNASLVAASAATGGLLGTAGGAALSAASSRIVGEDDTMKEKNVRLVWDIVQR
ncbi:hypothetical protein SpCBS45565_g08483 [Spizellomyces sp. 'palustris']|nr:hypothetical protein SpCBS45565_g08483 [Spizellomyces sp. 'palustris']